MKSLWDHQRTFRGLTCGLPVRTVHSTRQFNGAPVQEPNLRRSGRQRTEDVIALNLKIKRLKAAGLTYEQITLATGASPNTICRHLNGHVRAVEKSAA